MEEWIGFPQGRHIYIQLFIKIIPVADQQENMSSLDFELRGNFKGPGGKEQSSSVCHLKRVLKPTLGSDLLFHAKPQGLCRNIREGEPGLPRPAPGDVVFPELS